MMLSAEGAQAEDSSMIFSRTKRKGAGALLEEADGVGVTVDAGPAGELEFAEYVACALPLEESFLDGVAVRVAADGAEAFVAPGIGGVGGIVFGEPSRVEEVVARSGLGGAEFGGFSFCFLAVGKFGFENIFRGLHFVVIFRSLHIVVFFRSLHFVGFVEIFCFWGFRFSVFSCLCLPLLGLPFPLVGGFRLGESRVSWVGFREEVR